MLTRFLKCRNVSTQMEKLQYFRHLTLAHTNVRWTSASVTSTKLNSHRIKNCMYLFKSSSEKWMHWISFNAHWTWFHRHFRIALRPPISWQYCNILQFIIRSSKPSLFCRWFVYRCRNDDELKYCDFFDNEVHYLIHIETPGELTNSDKQMKSSLDGSSPKTGQKWNPSSECVNYWVGSFRILSISHPF